MKDSPLLYEIDLVLGKTGKDHKGGEAFATVWLPLIPKIGQHVHFESSGLDTMPSGTYRVVSVAYHVRSHPKRRKFRLSRSVAGVTGDLFGISLTVIPE